MSKPRPVHPGKTFMLTRRCVERRHLLRPSDEVNQVLLYCLARASEVYSVEIHAACVLSNHYHFIVTDTLGRLPDFMQWVNHMVAKALNCHYGRWEYFWAPGTYSRVEVDTAEDVLDKMVYTLTNAVTAGLVPKVREWPGVCLKPLKKVSVEKPAFYFKKKKKGEREVLELETTKPKWFEDLSDDEFLELLAKRIADSERETAEKFSEEGREYLGRKAVQKMPFESRPRTREPRRNLNPQVAAKDKEKRLELLEKLKEFWEAYREALKRFREGLREVLFPAGTWLLRVRYGVSCAEP